MSQQNCVLDKVVWDVLLESGTRRSYGPNCDLVLDGEDGIPGFILEKGRVAMVKSSSSGKELIADMIHPHDLIGLSIGCYGVGYVESQEAGNISQASISPISFRTMIRCELIWIPSHKLLYLLRSHRDISLLLVRELLARLLYAQELERSLAYDRVEARLASVLLHLVGMERTEYQTVAPVEVAITRRELAEFIGTSVETVVRVAKTLQDCGIIDGSHRGRVVVNDCERLSSMVQH